MQREQGFAPVLGFGSLLGLVLVLVTFTTVRVLQSNGSLLAQPVGLSISGVLALTLFGGVLVVYRYELTNYAARIAGWTYIGSAAVTIAVVVNILTLELVRPGFTIALYMVTTSVAGGAVLGFMVGLYDAHQTRHQRELATKQAEAQTLSNRLSVLNRVLRHDIRTQAQLLQGSSERLESGDLSPASAAQQIQRTVGRLTTLSDQARQLQYLLDADEFEPEPMDVVTVVTDAGEMIQASHPELVIESDLPDEQFVEASPMLPQALEHVLRNVVEHTDKAEPRAEISVTTDHAADRPVKLSIADNGPGIDEKKMIPDTNESESQLHHSEGLGLWLVTWIVEKSRGDLQIETPDAEETGTVVTIALRTP